MTAPDDGCEVMVPRGPAGTYIRLSGLRRPHGDALVCLVVGAEAPGLSATIGVETLNGDGLAEYVRSLEEGFRGWQGERTWASFRRDVEIRAAHLGRSIRLGWTLRFPEWDADWTATVEVHVSPGEELKGFAADVTRFLEGS